MGIQVINNSSGPIAYLKLLGDVALTSSLVNVVDQANNQSILKLSTINAQFNFPPRLATSGTFSGLTISGLITPSGAGNFSPNIADIQYTIASTGAQTGTINGINLDAIETILGGFIHNLINLKVGGVSKFKVSNGGAFDLPIKLEGITSSFPMIKRNGAAIDFRLADDSSFANISAFKITSNHAANSSQGFTAIDTADKKALLTGSGGLNGMPSVGSTSEHDFAIIVKNNHAARFTLNLSLILGGVYNVAEETSAIFQIESTTKGFLMPRMTTAEINAIASPANGLMVYNTTQLDPCFYDGTGWKRLLHLAM